MKERESPRAVILELVCSVLEVKVDDSEREMRASSSLDDVWREYKTRVVH